MISNMELAQVTHASINGETVGQGTGTEKAVNLRPGYYE